jgi:prophage regulatory protein
MLKPTQTVNQTTEKISRIDPILRLRDFLQMTGLSRATAYRMMALGLLDRPIRISQRAVGWRLSTIQTFLDSRPSSTGLSKSKIYDDIKKRLFLPPVATDLRARAWAEHEVDSINRAYLAGKSEAEIRSVVADLIAARTSVVTKGDL